LEPYLIDKERRVGVGNEQDTNYMDEFGDIYDDDYNRFRFVYAEGGILYYKHGLVVDLDDEIGDIRSIISDRQKLLLRELEDRILDCEYSLYQLSSLLSTIDAIISLGVIASEGDFCRPDIVEESLIVVKNGRHLLQALTVDSFVPNDTFVSPEKNIVLITGPNSSGKSVYLKQVGLLVYLAHIGSFLPAEKAIIGMTDRILTRVSAIETVTKPLSSFASDLSQIRHIILNHTPRSLCLIDEFGKGTSPVDGVALLASCIKHFIDFKSKALFVLHFTEVFHRDIINLDHIPCIIPLRMEITREETTTSTNTSDGEDAVPLFRLRLGVSTSSEGFPCARAAGIAESVLQRAKDIKDTITNGENIRANPQCIKNDPLLIPKNKALLKKFVAVGNWENAPKPKLDGIVNALLNYDN